MQSIGDKVLWLDLSLQATQTLRLSQVLTTHPAGHCAKRMTRVRKLRFRGHLASQGGRDSLYTILDFAEGLKGIYIHSTMIELPLLMFIRDRHADTLEELHLRLPLEHSMTIIVLEELPRLRILSTSIERMAGAPPSGPLMTPGTRTSDTFTNLTFFRIDIDHTYGSAQGLRVMEVLGGARFPVLQVAHIHINGSRTDVLWANHLVSFAQSHSSHLRALTLNIPCFLMCNTLPHLTVRQVHLTSCAFDVPIGDIVPLAVTYFSIGGLSGISSSQERYIATQRILGTVHDRMQDAVTRGIGTRLRIIKLTSFAWNPLSPVNDDAWTLIDMINEYARLCAKFDLFLVDKMGETCDGRCIWVSHLVTLLCGRSYRSPRISSPAMRYLVRDNAPDDCTDVLP
jgi:hypothetical protein